MLVPLFLGRHEKTSYATAETQDSERAN